ncbi:Hypothetical protein SLIV_21543 [Streptomyces lividans TK24]|uniref:Secreted protein n=1 Tax=Streptomyces lividans TK24 TaxID=457428 RepID=A0ABX6TQF8_STRLI|nr:Hypothetical protein SLIV_21543 [Streptomyces lividans TK24]QSJ10811.1 Hypothetical protein SLIVDG2_21543 [Streptomyces lividans]QTD71721.1 Hypothetical protein SLIVYQS_21543 [Streptomyces lividans TK24] [Streptomyces lividans]
MHFSLLPEKERAPFPLPGGRSLSAPSFPLPSLESRHAAQ